MKTSQRPVLNILILLAFLFGLAEVNFATVTDTTGSNKSAKPLPASYFGQATVMSGTSTAKAFGTDKGVGSITIKDPYGYNYSTRTIWAGTIKGSVDNMNTDFYCIDINHGLAEWSQSQPHEYTDDGSTPNEITYILNNYYPFKSLPYSGALTESKEAAAVQLAIWHYSDNLDATTISVSDIKTRALQIIADADAHAAGFNPLETLLIIPTSQTIPVGSQGNFSVSTFDENGNPLANVVVSLSASSGTLSTTSIVTNSSGISSTVSLTQGASSSSVVTATANVKIPQGTRYVHKIQPNKYQKLVLATPAGLSRSVTASVNWYQPSGNCDLNGYKTYTQGGWGGASSSEPGQIRDLYFNSVFPAGLVIGGTYKVTLTSASTVANFLPSGGTPAKLTQNYTNPTSLNNTFAGQVAALTMNVKYSDAGHLGTNSTPLGDLVIGSGAFAGLTVNQFLAIANTALGGTTTSFTISQLNDAATAINENFDNGTVDKGYLTCASNIQAITPILECVTNNGDGTYTAHFGYNNPNSFAITIPAGNDNKFTPGSPDQGQTTTFNPGRTPYYPNADFQIVFNGGTLTWTLNGQTAVATANSTPCSEHIYFDKKWYDENGSLMNTLPSGLPSNYQITVTSTLGTATGTYVNGNLVFTYSNNTPATDNNGLWVPVNGTYTVTESNMPAGYLATAGVGTFTAELPGGYATNPYNNSDNSGLHIIKNQKQNCTNSIGDYIWHDKNVDGKQNNNEPGIAGVVVELYNSSNTLIGKDTTDSNGKYLFTNLANGTYKVKVADENFNAGGMLYSTAQVRWYSTKKNQGNDDTIDSDADQGEKATVTVNCNDDLTIDFGFYKTCVGITKTADKQTYKPGEKITYTFVVENCGDIQLHGGIDLYDEMLKPNNQVYKHIDVLDPGATTSFTDQYTVTANDCGSLTNTVRAEGHPVDGSRTVVSESSVTVDVDCSTGCVTDWSGTLGPDSAICVYQPTPITVTGSVHLTPNPSHAKLQTTWRIVHPNRPDVDNSTHYTTVDITGDTTFSITAQWPGIAATDTVVEIHYGVNILDCDGNVIHNGIGRDLYWYPWVCAPPHDNKADLEIHKTSNVTNPVDGDQVTYTITVKNNGPDEATGVEATDILPGGLTFISSTPSQGTYNHTTGIWQVGTLANNATATLSITVSVDMTQVNSTTFDLGPAIGYNTFVLYDVNQPSADTEGKMAVGGNATLAAYSVGDKLPANSGDVLIVGGNLTYTSGRVYNGNVVYGNATNLPISSVSIDGTLTQASPINFAAAKTYLQNLSTQLSTYTANGTTTFQWSGLTLTGTDPYLNVFNVNGSDLSTATSFDITAPSGSVVLVNIDGTNVTWGGGLTVNGTTINNVLYNFYQATDLKIRGIDIRGSLLAPFADVNFESGVINGQFIAKSLTGMGQFNNSLFMGSIPVEKVIINIATITGSLVTDPVSSNNTSSATLNVNSTSGSGGTGGSGGSGSNWQPVGNFAQGEIVYSITSDAQNLYAGTLGGHIYRSTDNGTTWTLINSDMHAAFIWSMAVSNGYVYAATEQGIYRYNGSSWSLIGLEGTDVRAIAADHNGVLYAGTWGFGIYRSTDNGATWKELINGLNGYSAIQSIVVNSKNDVFAASLGGGVFKLEAGSSTWTRLTCYNFVWALGITSTDEIYAGTYGDGMYKSVDDGATWTKLSSVNNSQYIYSITVDAADHIYASSWTSGVFVSSDFGNTFTSLGMGGFGVSSLCVNPNSNNIYAGTKEGKIYMKSVDGTTAVDNKEMEIPTEFNLAQNYPNPFNPATTIEFAIPQSGRFTLKIYNVLGQEVATLVNGEMNAGYHKVTFNASSFASGLYIYRLSGNNVNMVKKMMLLK